MKTFDLYKKEFRRKAENVGFSEEEIIKCLNYAEPIYLNKLPVIYNISHLSALVGYNTTYLRRAIKSGNTPYFYRKYSIPKKNGGSRTINEPLPSLKEIQQWILNNILYNIPISRYAKAYTKKRGLKDHLKYHKDQNIVLTLDIENFFGMLSIDKVRPIFLSRGYSEWVSDLITKLCCLNDTLPQGAPTSPRLSNIIMFPFDESISKYCKTKDIKYTRYADDLAFSGDLEKEEIVDLVSSELTKIGLSLNKEKTMYMSRDQPQLISGVLVNKVIQVPRSKRDELRQAFYYIDKFGLESHLAHINSNKGNYLKHLIGIANYITYINPKDSEAQIIKQKLYKYLD